MLRSKQETPTKVIIDRLILAAPAAIFIGGLTLALIFSQPPPVCTPNTINGNYPVGVDCPTKEKQDATK